MARLPKKGLIYFNIDCEQEDNLNFIEAKHGIVGYGVVVKLWKKIYQFQGYYCDWNERNIYLFAREINVDISKINDIVETCFEEKIFSRQLFSEYQILTSSGVQKRWKKIVTEAKRKDVEVEERYSLLPLLNDKEGKTPEETEKNPELISQRKEKEINEDENIQTERGREAGTPSESVLIGNGKSRLKKAEDFPTDKKNVAGQPSGFSRPNYEEVRSYFLKSAGHIWDQSIAHSQADLFISYYDANGWMQNNNKPIVNWEAAASGWILREMNGNFNIRGTPNLNRLNDSKAAVTVNFKADIEYLYATFLEDKLNLEQIETCYFDYLKKENLIQFSDKIIVQIQSCAREKRMKSLLGTNQAELTRIYQAYENGATPNDPNIKKDMRVYNKVVKRLAVMTFFQQLKDENRSSVFN